MGSCTGVPAGRHGQEDQSLDWCSLFMLLNRSSHIHMPGYKYRHMQVYTQVSTFTNDCKQSLGLDKWHSPVTARQ